MPIEPKTLAAELLAAYASRQSVLLPTSRDAGFDLGAAYAVEMEVAALRRAQGRHTVGRKVGYANRTLWRVFKLDSVVWAHMYDDTVHFATGDAASLSLRSMYAPKLEPEIIFKLKHAPAGDPADPAAALEALEWMSLGFEIVDCLFPDWRFKPADFVASLGLHAGLIVGEPRVVHPAMIPELRDRLASATARLLKDGQPVAEGSGANVLGSPALCLGELARGIARHPNAEPLAPGEIIATGALIDNQFIAPAELWAAAVEGLELPSITVRTTE